MELVLRWRESVTNGILGWKSQVTVSHGPPALYRRHCVVFIHWSIYLPYHASSSGSVAAWILTQEAEEHPGQDITPSQGKLSDTLGHLETPSTWMFLDCEKKPTSMEMKTNGVSAPHAELGGNWTNSPGSFFIWPMLTSFFKKYIYITTFFIQCISAFADNLI